MAHEEDAAGGEGAGTFQTTMSPAEEHNRDKTPRPKNKSGPTKAPSRRSRNVSNSNVTHRGNNRDKTPRNKKQKRAHEGVAAGGAGTFQTAMSFTEENNRDTTP